LDKVKSRFEILTKKAEELSEILMINKENNLEYKEIQRNLDEKMKNWRNGFRLEEKFQTLNDESNASFGGFEFSGRKLRN